MHEYITWAGQNKFQRTNMCAVDVEGCHERQSFIHRQNSQAKCFKFSLRTALQLNPHLIFEGMNGL
jgi:hypothetical protein